MACECPRNQLKFSSSRVMSLKEGSLEFGLPNRRSASCAVRDLRAVRKLLLPSDPSVEPLAGERETQASPFSSHWCVVAPRKAKGSFSRHVRLIRMLRSVRPVCQLSLLACMEVRRPDPNQTDVLEARKQLMVSSILSYRLCAVLSFDRLPSCDNVTWLPVYPEHPAQYHVV